MKISDQTYSIGAFLGKDPEDVKQQKQDKLEQQIDEVHVHEFVYPTRKTLVLNLIYIYM